MIRVEMVEALKKDDRENIGPFRLRTRLGAGGFGTVYAAQRRDQPHVMAAVKVVHDHLADYPDFRARFAREVAGIKRVECDFVPRLIDERTDGDPAWMATELIPGLPLARVVYQCGPLPEQAVWQLGAGIAEALAAIHGKGLVHRDLKPQNVLMVLDRPWVIDFSLVHLADMPHHSSSRLPMATFKYAAPEQLGLGLQAAGEPADVFALGATLLYAATGHAPHDADSESQLFARAMNARPNLTGLPPAFYDLVESCLRRSPDARPPLAALRAEFARRTGGVDHNAFATALPSDAATLLRAYRAELATKLKTRGPARLGWGNPSQEPTVTQLADGVSPLPSVDSLGLPHTQPGSVAQSPVPAGPRRDGREAGPGPKPDQAASPRAADSRITRRLDRTKVMHPGAVPARWTHQFDSWIQAPVAVHGDTVVVACLDGTVAALRSDEREARELWHKPVHVGAALHAPALILAKGRGGATAYLGAADGYVHAIDLSSGQERTVVQAATAIEGAPVATGNRVHALSADGRVYSVDPHTDERKVLGRIGGAATGAPSAADGTIFASDTGGRVYALDAVSGRQRWQLATDGLVLAAPLAVAGWLYICGTDGMLRQVDVEDGHERASAKTGAPIHVAPVCDGNRLYVGGSDGVIRAYDIGSRGLVDHDATWEYPLDDEIAGLAVADGRVYAAAGYRLMELNGAGGQESKQLLRLNGLIGAPPVISGRRCYVVGLGGVVTSIVLG